MYINWVDTRFIISNIKRVENCRARLVACKPSRKLVLKEKDSLIFHFKNI